MQLNIKLAVIAAAVALAACGGEDAVGEGLLGVEERHAEEVHLGGPGGKSHG